MRSQVLAWLADNVSSHRLQHILGVEQMCLQLARQHRVNPEKAARAGLMHDLAKFFPPPQLLAMVRQEGWEIDPVCAANPHLLHADASAIVARERFGVRDEETLTAIRNHTLGSPHMSPLCCIVFVADALEPNRGSTPELEAMRQGSRHNLYRSVQQACDYSLKHLLNTSRTIHPRAVLTRNWALQMAKQSLPVEIS